MLRTLTIASLCTLSALTLALTPAQPERTIRPRPTPLTPHSSVSGDFTIAIDGAKQGKFKGDGTHDNTRDKIIGLGFDYELKTSRDPASGQTIGKRQHQPIVITKEWGAASPQLFQAATTNENLKSVTLEFTQTGSTGASEVFYTIKLTNASIAGIHQYTDSGRFYEEVSFAFQKIEVEHKPSKTAASDDWGK